LIYGSGSGTGTEMTTRAARPIVAKLRPMIQERRKASGREVSPEMMIPLA
jgi:hypothetical protein